MFFGCFYLELTNDCYEGGSITGTSVQTSLMVFNGSAFVSAIASTSI